MRHFMFGAKADGARDAVVALSSSQCDALAPPLGSRGMTGAPAARALVTTGGLAPGEIVLLPAGAAAVPVAAIAAAAQDDLHTAPDAQEQTGWTVQRHHQTEPVVLDGIVPARHTDAAPPSSARCRARRGHQAARRERTAAVPIFFGSPRVVSELSQAGQPRTAARAASLSTSAPGSDGDSRESWNADVALTGLVALQGDQANKPLIDQLLSTNCLEPPKVGHSNQIRVLAVKKWRFLTSVHTCPKSERCIPGPEAIRSLSRWGR